MLWIVIGLMNTALVAEVPLPARGVDAPKGSEFVRLINDLGFAEREALVRDEVLRGNVPDYWRKFASVKAGPVEYFVAPDYLAIGTDQDYFLSPLSPNTAQLLADRLDCLLPTPRMVDQIYAAATAKVSPQPIPPSAAMTTAPIFAAHNAMVRQSNPGGLISGHKKDVVISARLPNSPGKVAIYGWHKTNGEPIQPLYLGHTDRWVDYSHGIRFVSKSAKVDGQARRLDEILAHPTLSTNLSAEGPLTTARYTNVFRERVSEFRIEPGVRVVLNAPEMLNANAPVRLAIYALPNGNTIEQTIGRKLKPGDDWHFDIQHIGAQTRWLRERMTDAQLVVAYLECAEKAWPSWRRKYDPANKRVGEIVQSLRERFPANELRIVLTGHSGGGSFTFGYLNGIAGIPGDIERIAFLDSNYAYDSKLPQAEKMLQWLKASEKRFFAVLAYNDAIALLDGKPFVSESGGTWGRSRAMLEDFSKSLSFEKASDVEWQRFNALNGRVQFILKENPDRVILHTRQVELNGFIHAMVTGTTLENRGYTYFGERAFGVFIAP